MPYSVFLTEPEKHRISRWKYQVDDRSITTKLFTPFWNYLISWIPESVAPNILTLAGFLCLLQSTYLTYQKVDDYPYYTTMMNMFLIFAYQTLDALDGKQARKTKNSTPVGEMFDHCCDNLGVILIVLTLARTFNIGSTLVQWLLMSNAMMVFMFSHIMALRNKVVTMYRFTGPGEALIVLQILLSLKFWDVTLSLPHPLTEQVLMSSYFALSMAILIYSIFTNYGTRNGVWLCLAIKNVSHLVSYYHLGDVSIGLMDIVFDGMFWCLVTGDLIVSKMGERDIHPAIVICAMFSSITNWSNPIMLAYYYVSVFRDLCDYMNIYMFSTTKNVYVSGVFDLFHVGHVKYLERALQHGTRLIVGVMSDESTAQHKRQPVMTMNERVQAVRACKYVSEVIPGAPWEVATPDDFIHQHNIHVVPISEEYFDDSSENNCYRNVIDNGMARRLERFPEMSTSELIRRCKERFQFIENDDPEFKELADILQKFRDENKVLEHGLALERIKKLNQKLHEENFY